jgi:hypothetical protein
VNCTSGRAQLSGRANVQDITNPLNPISMFGNGTFQMKASDISQSGQLDSISIVFYHPQTGLWYASNWNGISGIEQVLDGGNIQVRNGSTIRYSADHNNDEETGTSDEEIRNIPTDKVSLSVLSQNYPNPAMYATTIEFMLEKDAKAEIRIFNQNGVLVKVIGAADYQAGQVNKIELDVNDLPNGNYFYQLISTVFSDTKQMIIVK